MEKVETTEHIAAALRSAKTPIQQKPEAISIAQLLDWAEDLRKEYAAGILSSWKIKALEETPGWHW
jgi:hypothetical protein